jgi:hypothetical protein
MTSGIAPLPIKPEPNIQDVSVDPKASCLPMLTLTAVKDALTYVLENVLKIKL